MENLEKQSQELLQRWISSLSTLSLVPCELYKVKKARGDGNCFFYSLLQANNTVAANELRKRIAMWIEKNGHVVLNGQSVQQWVEQQRVPRRRTVTQYAEALRSGLWVGALEIKVFTQLHPVTVELYVKEGVENYRQVDIIQTVQQPVERVVRLFFTEGHYDWLVVRNERLLEEARLLQSIANSHVHVDQNNGEGQCAPEDVSQDCGEASPKEQLLPSDVQTQDVEFSQSFDASRIGDWTEQNFQLAQEAGYAVSHPTPSIYSNNSSMTRRRSMMTGSRHMDGIMVEEGACELTSNHKNPFISAVEDVELEL